MIIESSEKNTYYFNPNERYLSIIHPLLKEFTKHNFDIKALQSKGYSEDDILYYQSKYEFLKSNKLISPSQTKNFNYKLTTDDVKFSLQNCTDIMLEVTTFCNISCAYCIYGNLYTNEKPKHQNLSLNKAIRLIDYMLDLKTKNSSSIDEKIMIHFYGGEPLLNMNFITEIVKYIKHIKSNFSFEYGITTNTILLHKYIDFFVENNINILISLDGDTENNSYRTFSNGKYTFEQVLKNSLLIKDKYPEYFEKYVSFNAVLHNRNTLEEIHQFFKKTFDKIPLVADLNSSEINPDKKEEFLSTYQSVDQSYRNIKNELIKNELYTFNSEFNMALDFMEKYSPSIYNNTIELTSNRKNVKIYPTGTCMPFSRSIFLNANGNIMPCVQISPQFSLGNISENTININFKEIANLYNSFFEKINNQCKSCYNSEYCNKCIFQIPNINLNPVCPDFQNKKEFQRIVSYITSSIEEKPQNQIKIINQIQNEN